MSPQASMNEQVGDLSAIGDHWPAIPRVPTSRSFTPMETVVISFLAEGYNYSQIARLLSVSYQCVKAYALAAAKKIPGDLPAQMRIVVWFRGATRDVLTGERMMAGSQMDESPEKVYTHDHVHSHATP